jgi:hypothetical protein
VLEIPHAEVHVKIIEVLSAQGIENAILAGALPTHALQDRQDIGAGVLQGATCEASLITARASILALLLAALADRRASGGAAIR